MLLTNTLSQTRLIFPFHQHLVVFAVVVVVVGVVVVGTIVKADAVVNDVAALNDVSGLSSWLSPTRSLKSENGRNQSKKMPDL